ncbi:MAG: BON domain-containing protein [Acidimicrobiia bacterium]
MRRARWILVGVLVGPYLDPVEGAARRQRTRAALARGMATSSRALRSRSPSISARCSAVAQRLVRQAPADDALSERVRSEALTAWSGWVSARAHGSTVTLHGEVPRIEDIDAIALSVHAVDGVDAVENLLHLSGSPSPAEA